ncbi:uncharacterized protein LOC124936287 [Impatiens glandulifera]|uniref:uncharacterized protein LOC124936287 n=1 Tax=Impatiens glandulifera TaxID=253017 RepID=UPI001FB16F89|nr:uncharacterized protein LOC124936287 [Impatiens glandulifera]
MPRPGPRPYECVRRAWHSERHQPLRGSIIQQIFRVVHDSHSSSTKKNREWQEKLPIVVLKAEEIIYSKANSEAEYLDSHTLWERINDAINTIIRRDETTETGLDLLPPCVEAALNLGCVPVRASRSQRNANPRTYLSPRIQEPASAIHHPLEKNNPSSSTNQFNQIQNNAAPANVGSVYPLYYGNDFQSSRPHLESSSSFPNPIIVGRQLTLATPAAASSAGKHELRPPPTCDLTLRLGLGLDLGLSTGMGTTRNSPVLHDNIDLNLLPEEEIFRHRHGKELSFQHCRRDKGKLGEVSRKRNIEDEDDGPFYTQPRRPSTNQFTYQSKKPGL